MDLIYILHKKASEQTIVIKGEIYKYLVKIRRHCVGEELLLRSPNNLKLRCRYEIVDIAPRSLELKLISSKEQSIENKKSLHVAWCVIDVKSIEKVLPSLNEIGVDKISFIYCERSQNSVKLDFNRFNRILETSMQQCGRTSFIEFNIYKNIKDFIAKFPNTKVFDFCDNVLAQSDDIQTVLIGCEGGFSKNEREFLKSQQNFRLDTPMVLRSETATMAVASKILL